MRKFWFCLLALFFVGCSVSGIGLGGWSKPTVARFINHAHFSITEPEFQTLMEQRWKMAQDDVANKSQFNLDGTKLTGPDPRALSVNPNNVVVESQPDIPASVINATPGIMYGPYTDPTGFIKCPDDMPGYCNAWMKNMCSVVVPDGHPEYVGPYEFSNCILFALGHDVRGR